MTAIPGNLLAYNTESVETDATGWGTTVNCAATRQTTQHLEGSASLRLVSTTSGAMTCKTATPVTLPAGTQYVSFGGGVFSANLLSSVVTVQWLDGTGAIISNSSTAAVAPGNGTAFWYIHGGAAVPTGAVTANLIVQCTATASSQTVYWDRMWIAPQAVWGGQLIPLDAEFNEQMTAQWTATTNCTAAVGAIGTYYPAWGSALQLTATAAGDMRAVPSSGPVAVTPGVEYMATGYYAQTSGSNRTALIEIEWLASDGTTLVSSTVSPLFTVVSATWTRVTAISTCPAGAVKAQPRLRPQAGAASEVWFLDQLGLVTTSSYMAAGNLLGYNAASVEMDVSPWNITGGTKVRSTTEVFDGTYSLAVTATGTADMVVQLATSIPVTVGSAYQFSPLFWPATPSGTTTIQLDWLDGSGDIVQSTTSDFVLPPGSTSTWYSDTAGDLCPATAVSLQPSLIFRAPTSGEVFYLDDMFAGAGGLAATVAELSGEYAAQISIQGLTTSGATFYTLQRMLADGTLVPVRGETGDLTNVPIVGDVAVVTDYEAPLGVPVRWYVQIGDGVGDIYVDFTTSPLTLTEPPRNYLVAKDPLLPARNGAFIVSAPADWTRAASSAVFQPRGASLPIVRYDKRKGRTGTLVLLTATDDERQQLEWMLATGNTLLLQAPTGTGWDDIYVQVGDVVEPRTVPTAADTTRLWSLPLTEVGRPVGGAVGSASRTWQDVLSGYSTWYDVYQAYSTWAGVLTGVEGT